MLTVDPLADSPLAQKRASGSISINWFSLKVEQVPQNFLQITLFSELSSPFATRFTGPDRIEKTIKRLCTGNLAHLRYKIAAPEGIDSDFYLCKQIAFCITD